MYLTCLHNVVFLLACFIFLVVFPVPSIIKPCWIELCLFYRCENWGPERKSDLPANVAGRIWTLVSLSPKPLLYRALPQTYCLLVIRSTIANILWFPLYLLGLLPAHMLPSQTPLKGFVHFLTYECFIICPWFKKPLWKTTTLNNRWDF